MTDLRAANGLLVPAGERLIAGRLYLQLTHGRKDPDEQMDDWGFTGPTFGPLTCVGQTYCTTLRLYGDHQLELWLDHCEDMDVWDGAFYSEMSIFIVTGDEHG